MVSSLAAQLAQGASLNASLLSQRKKNRESYLFTGRDADQHDLESLHALGVNGLIQLSSLTPALRIYEETLFGYAAKGTDRTLLSAEADAELNKSKAGFLRMIGPYLMEPPTQKVIEWLVRRFRINEFNVEDVLALFLPYHESPHFAKMLTILHIKEHSTWRFLLAFKSAAQNVPRMSLVTEMLKNSDASRFITSLLPDAITGGYVHRTLLAFNAATLHDFVIRAQSLDEGTMAYLLPALLEPLQKNFAEFEHLRKDAILGSYILISALSQKCHLAPKALKAILSAMASCAPHVATHQYVNAAVSVCEPQDELDSLSESTVKSILRLPGIVADIQKALAWVGIEKLVCPMIPELTQRMNEDTTLSLMQALVISPNVPSIILQKAAATVMRQAVTDEGLSTNTPARQFLSAVHQRHPAKLQKIGETMASEGEDTKLAVERLLISLSMNYPKETVEDISTTSDLLDMIVGSTHADIVVRVDAVKRSMNELSTNDKLEPSEISSIHSALLARVQDTSTQVLDALYVNPPLIVPILSKNLNHYINHLTASLCTPNMKPARALVRVHFAFLASHFCSAADSVTLGEVFNKIFSPFLLFSNSRQKTANVVWDIVTKNEQGGLGKYELLGGCCALWKEAGELNSVKKMSGLNLVLASRIAGNILKSNDFSNHFDSLLGKLEDGDAHTRIFAYLTTHALLDKLSGSNHVDASHKVLRAMNLGQMEDASSLKGSIGVADALSDDNLSKAVVHKPGSSSTTRLLQISILGSISRTPRPMNEVLDWFASRPSLAEDSGAYLYMELLRTVYKLAITLPAPISTTLLEIIITNLKDDSLAFLSGIWTNSTESEICTIALRHATACLEAHRSTEQSIDFQTILPSLLVSLQSSDTHVRTAALECLSQLVLLTGKRFSAVYGLDTIYGDGSDKLQFLERDDYKKYITALAEQKEYLASDPHHVSVFHQEHLGENKSDKKKVAEYKKRVLCYLLSHVDAVSSPDVQLAILRTVRHVSDQVKAQVLLPMMQSLVQDLASKQRLAEVYGTRLEEFATLILCSIDRSTVEDLNEPESPLWPIFLSALEYCFQSGSPSSLRSALIDSLEGGLFASLSLEHKLAVCDLTLRLGTRATSVYQICKNFLVHVLKDIPVIVQLLASLLPTPHDDTPRASKRPRTMTTTEDSLSCLTLLAEVLTATQLPGSIDLTSRLLETLGLVLQYPSPSEADMSYLEQLLMSSVENAANKVMEVPNLTPSAIRLDVLVDLIRVANNPQTFHQALLLVASLARLAPESVLHNVMPIFTFMGSNVFHRDDSYSFTVIQKTIDGIVPVMASSLRKTYSDRIALYLGSRVFLRIFADAANHIPRHRRTNFFTHLVDVLGAHEFLAPVVMLLVEKIANRVARQTPQEVKSSLNLPTSILQHYPVPLRLFIMTELLRECLRLIARAQFPENTMSTFMETILDEDCTTSPSTTFKHRAQSLVYLVEDVLKHTPSPLPAGSTSDEGSVSDLVSLLLRIATPHIEGSGDEVSQAARSCLSQAVKTMSAPDLMDALLAMLGSEESPIEAAALGFLSDSLPDMTDQARREVSPTVEKILTSIQKVIALNPDGPLPHSAYQALKKIAATTPPGQEGILVDLIPVVISSIKSRKATESAMAVLPPLINKLGPRVIPHFRELVTQCVAVVGEVHSGNSALPEECLHVFRALLNVIPTFWSTSELSQVVKLYVDNCSSSSNIRFTSLTTLMKAIAKQAPAKVLLPTLCEIWPSVASASRGANPQRYTGYLHLLKRSLRSAARPAVLEHLRPLFNVFLEALDTAPLRDDEAENGVISAFLELVVKLNESAFRPLFRRMHDWAFVSESDNANRRKIMICRVYIALLDYFKELMASYMSFMLEPFITILKAYSNSSADDVDLWTVVIECLTKSFNVDEGVFWREDKLRQISPLMIEHVSVGLRLSRTSDGKTMFSDCLCAMTACVNDDTLLKSINLDLLMHTRSEDLRLRLFALTCAEALWRAHGNKLIGFVPETTSFIVECAEDENDSVVRQAHKLKDAVENVAGNLNR